MRALVKIGFYYHKQHLRSKFNYIYFYFKPACACVCVFFLVALIFTQSLFVQHDDGVVLRRGILYILNNIMCKDVVCATPLYACKQERGSCLFSRNYHVSLFVGGSSVYCTIN